MGFWTPFWTPYLGVPPERGYGGLGPLFPGIPVSGVPGNRGHEQLARWASCSGARNSTSAAWMAIQAADVLSDNPVDVSTQFSLAQHSMPKPLSVYPVPALDHWWACASGVMLVMSLLMGIGDVGIEGITGTAVSGNRSYALSANHRANGAGPI